MTTLHEAAQQALEALELVTDLTNHDDEIYDAITALKAALAEPEQEPVAWSFEARHIDTAFGPAVSIRHPGREHKYMRNVKPLYTAPPQRKPLTREEAIALWADKSDGPSNSEIVLYCRAIERAHGITS